MGRGIASVTALAFVAVLLGAQPALAKFENAQITVEGPGLSAPIVLSGDDALLWERYGVFGQKWPSPNVNGKVDPRANLGPEYQVAVAFDCPHSTRGGFAETLYPYAPGGPQIFTSPGAVLCSSALSPGYLPASVRLLHALVAKGLPRNPPVEGGSASARQPVIQREPWKTIGLIGLLALAAAAGVIAVRRRSPSAV